MALKIIDSKVLLTSKQGEFYLIADFSVESVNDSHKLPSEAHYKGVFTLQGLGDTIVSCAMDRRVCLFSLEDNAIAMKWKLSLFGSRVTHLKQSPTEKNLIFFTGPELALRSLDVSKKHDSCYINEFWKGIFKVDNFWAHGDLEGVFCLAESKKMQVQDIYKEDTLGTIVMEDPISQVIWISEKDCANVLTILRILEKNYGKHDYTE